MLCLHKLLHCQRSENIDLKVTDIDLSKTEGLIVMQSRLLVHIVQQRISIAKHAF